MYPELFTIPFIHLTVKSYGLMMAIGFIAAVFLMRSLSRHITDNPHMITNAALYSLIAGVIGARLFFFAHHYSEFQGNWLHIFAVWYGGLEFLGGVIFAMVVILIYLFHHKLPVRRYLDIMAIGLMLALAFGRIGCFLIGDCFGKPTKLPWGICFPYRSHVYISQVNPNLQRNRPEPQLQVPPEYYGYTNKTGIRQPKTYENLTSLQKTEVTKGKYRCLPVHPTQLYSSANAAVLCLILYFFWRRNHKPGQTFSLMFILYGITRFLIEFLRDDNPFEYSWWAIYKGGTISQNLGIYMTILGLLLMVIFQKINHKSLPSADTKPSKSVDRNV